MKKLSLSLFFVLLFTGTTVPMHFNPYKPKSGAKAADAYEAQEAFKPFFREEFNGRPYQHHPGFNRANPHDAPEDAPNLNREPTGRAHHGSRIPVSHKKPAAESSSQPPIFAAPFQPPVGPTGTGDGPTEPTSKPEKPKVVRGPWSYHAEDLKGLDPETREYWFKHKPSSTPNPDGKSAKTYKFPAPKVAPTNPVPTPVQPQESWTPPNPEELEAACSSFLKLI